MYVVRGKTNDGKLNDVVQVLNLTTFVWKDVPTTGKPPPPRVAKTCLITHKLFTFGESDCDKMHVLDIENMTWESDNFIRSVSGHAMHSLGTKLLLYGGIQRGKELNSKTIISFDTCSQAHLRLNFTDITDSVAKAVALYDFEPRPNEHHLLSFKEGDLINLLPDDEENSKTSIHWAKALRGGSLESFVQRDYIKVINETSIVRPTMLMDDRKLTKKDLGKRIQILETGDVVAVVERGNDRLGYKSIPREQFTEWEEKFIPRDEQQPIGRSHCSSCVIDEKFLFVWSGVSSNGTHLQDGWLLNTEDWSWSRISDDKPPSPGCIGTPACSIDGVAYIPDLVNLVVHCYSMLDGVWRSCKLQPIMLPPPSSSSSSSSSNETDSSDSCNEITSVTEKLTSVRTANGVNSSFAAVDEMSEARKPPMSSELAPSRERSRVSSPTRKSEATASRASAPSYVPQESIQRSPSESYVGRITPLPPVSESPSRVSEHLHIPTSIAAGEWGPSSPGWESPKRYMVNPIKLSPSCFHSGNYWEK
eukprot:TRINITY_DN13385_c0_g1_i1.p1 TRINITY_DN13385_c0_g1~~TRINITY_DN13385_c0_g1_i1.p1  ORF type:complete len:617 (+),score=98.81 TRINITY_DN13385_c0_g1_i1:253-1851(+)